MSPDTPDPDRPVVHPAEPEHVDPTVTGADPRPGDPAGADPHAAQPFRSASDADPATGGGPASTAASPSPGTDPIGARPGTGQAVPATGGTSARPAAESDPVAVTDTPRRAWAGAVGAGLALAVLGAPLGLLWAAVAPGTPVIKATLGAVYAEPQPEQPIAADGWFSLLGLGFGVLAALALWFVLRRRRGPVGLASAVLGAFAAAVVAWQVGRRIGLAEFDRLLATAPEGQAFSKPADLRAGGIDWLFGVLPVPHGNLLLPAFGAAVTYTLLAGWSRWPSLRPEPQPDPAALSWVSAATPAPPTAPEPPAPGAAEPPRG
ncbi:DUF2567 domain-containing protein [Micromonospora avicenniae]|uniref:DUF2567 domain-containing protein n=1 Tax=Micromonospora avicenniae TaxID=1198245 RepID=A0A1N6SGU8_9ACTN|nr:hypothetical protein SAMN05444858_102257 [Micromonospora avicenniae]